MSDIGTRIKKYRKLKKLTQKQLGQLSNTSETTIKQYETGKRQPRIEQLRKIANVLSVQVADLITGYQAEDLEGVSPEHPIAFPGLEKKLAEIGYRIFYGCDYIEYGDDQIWIEYPDGKQLFLTLSELENLNFETDIYLKFRIDQLRDKKA